MSNKVMLVPYGLVIAESAISSVQFLVQSERNTSIIRAFDLTGISYTEEQSLRLSARLFISDLQTVLLLKAAGATIDQVDVGEEAVSFLDIPLSSTTVDERIVPLIAHPTFLRRSRKEKNAIIFQRKIERYLDAVRNMGNRVDFTPEDDQLDEDDSNLGGPRITDVSKSAQLDAHHSAQQEYRQRAEDVLAFFESTIIEDGLITEVVPFSDAMERFNSLEVDGEKLFSFDKIFSDYSELVVSLS